uniref:RING-type E3 ubiquitin transferase n=1 Tax=Diabrotica virgifera virgifera TaxID=50390 RepID=A0A6P7GJS5_DIAVI
MSDKDLQRELECPICFSYLQPPIRMCIKGHSICSTCRNKLTVCPTCRSTFSNASNISLESIIPLLKLPCKYSHRGCEKLLLHSDRLAHEVDCPYKGKILDCPGCSFKGSITDQEKHCRIVHSVQNIDQYDCSNIFSCIGILSSVNTVVQNDDKCFWLKALKSADNNNILFSVDMIGTEEEAAKYGYKLIFSKELQKMCFEGICNPLGLNDKQLSTPIKSFNLSVRGIESFLGNDCNISIKIRKNSIEFWHYLLPLMVLAISALSWEMLVAIAIVSIVYIKDLVNFFYKIRDRCTLLYTSLSINRNISTT